MFEMLEFLRDDTWLCMVFFHCYYFIIENGTKLRYYSVVSPTMVVVIYSQS